MMRRPVILGSIWAAMLALPVLADVRVQDTSDGVVVRVDGGSVAVFQPVPNQVWVVGDAGKVADYAIARSGWRVETLKVVGGAGVKLTTPQPRAWRVLNEGGTWRVQMGEQGGVSKASALITRTGLVGGLPVQDRQGTRYWVKPTSRGGMGTGQADGLLATVQGVVLEQGFTLAARPVKNVQKPVVVQVEVPTALPPLVVRAVVEDVGKAFPRTASLPKVPTPVGEAAALVEDIEPASGPEPVTAAKPTGDWNGVYTPGTLVPFVLPEGYRLEKGQLRRENVAREIEKRLAFARSISTLEAAADRVEGVASKPVPAKLPAMPVVESKPLISSAATIAEHLEASATEHGAEMPLDAAVAQLALEDGSAMFPTVGSPREYWKGLTVRVVALNRAMARAGAKALEPVKLVVVEGEAASEGAAVEPHAGPEEEVDATSLEAPVDAVWEKTPDTVANTPAVVKARRGLAAYHLAWGRPHEALVVASMLPTREDGLPVAADDRLMMGMAMVVAHRSAEALPLLAADASTLPEHRALWKSIALQHTGRDAEALKVWPGEQNGVLMAYPVYMRRMALQSHGDALLAAGTQDELRVFADNVANEYPVDAVPSGLLYLQGMARLGTRDEPKGMELLASAAASTQDMDYANRAKYAFVNALVRRGELEDRQVVAYLEELRMLWRGDKLEQNVLNQLGDTYLKERNYRNALGRWQTLVKAYPDFAGMAALTDKMTAATVGVFDPENPEQLDALTYLGLYFDFKELLPSDDRGDRAMEMAGRLLSSQSLPERAIPVLEQVLQYRAREPIDKARVALLLADAYTRFNKPDLALRTLDAYKPMAVNTVQQKVWPVAEARALLDLDRPTDALTALQGSTEEQAPWLRSDAGWALQDWPYLAEVLKPVVRALVPESLPNNTANQVAVMRLAYALGQQQDRPALEALLERFGPTARTLPAMADSMAAIATQSGVAKVEDAARPLAQVADALAGLNAYTDQFKARQHEVKQRIEEREEYNSKMKYNELLPPPVL
ncbi:MAG: hypothetical protein WAZ18_02880 [Alphaproteobacteria bacterium]